MIKNIADIAAHLGASNPTAAAIESRIFKNTSCGCSSSVENKVLERYHRGYPRTYVVQVRPSVPGSMVVAWRKSGGKKQESVSGAIGIPLALAEFLGLYIFDRRLAGVFGNPSGRPCIGEEWVGRGDCRREYGTKYLRGLKPDDQTGHSDGIVRVTRRGGSTYLTVRVWESSDSSARGTVFWVAGYCEGTDRLCETHEVLLPCKPEEIDKAIADADQDGCDLWNETHGCEHCYPDGYCDVLGNSWTPDGDNWVGQPINPECETCKGQGSWI